MGAVRPFIEKADHAQKSSDLETGDGGFYVPQVVLSESKNTLAATLTPFRAHSHVHPKFVPNFPDTGILGASTNSRQTG